ncbi:hypothetical protein [Desulfosporosinus lacus]|uniref:hypothetical protein n=1 Tax=Desulfosporosinus lacus TaxID=329936 RepID=UPI001160E4EA|nr:hypothetical protein [Desulfosporosinus lacus]
MCDTALGAYDAEQTNRLSSPGLGERGSSFGDSIILKNPPTAIIYPTPVCIPLGITASAILSTGDYRAR